MSKITIKPFFESYLLGNGSDIEFVVSVDELEDLKDEIERIFTAQSAKPGQSIHSCTPCPADILTTPPNSRHPGAKDCEVRKHKLSEELE